MIKLILGFLLILGGCNSAENWKDKFPDLTLPATVKCEADTVKFTKIGENPFLPSRFYAFGKIHGEQGLEFYLAGPISIINPYYFDCEIRAYAIKDETLLDSLRINFQGDKIRSQTTIEKDLTISYQGEAFDDGDKEYYDFDGKFRFENGRFKELGN